MKSLLQVTAGDWVNVAEKLTCINVIMHAIIIIIIIISLIKKRQVNVVNYQLCTNAIITVIKTALCGSWIWGKIMNK